MLVGSAGAEGEIQRQIGAMVDEIHRAADQLEQAERYNRAVELANSHQFEAALDLLREVRNTTPDPELRRAAQELETVVRKLLVG